MTQLKRITAIHFKSKDKLITVTETPQEVFEKVVTAAQRVQGGGFAKFHTPDDQEVVVSVGDILVAVGVDVVPTTAPTIHVPGMRVQS